MADSRCQAQVGKRFGRLVVLEVLSGTEKGEPYSGAWARVRCDCGKRKTVRAKHLSLTPRQGKIASCGCGQPRELKIASAMRALMLGAA